MILPKEMIMKGGLVQETLGESQFQPAGVDVSLKEIYSFKNAGKIDFDNKERKISDVIPVPFVNDDAVLPAGAYKVIFNEYVRIPQDAAAFCFPRSSLLRSGITLECAVWDPGYEGRSEALLIVSNPHGAILKKNAKIGQLVFIRLVEKTLYSYEGAYKGENKQSKS